MFCYCGQLLKLQHKKPEADTLYKLYVCKNGHRITYRRYGYTIEQGDKVIESTLWYSPTSGSEVKTG